MNDKNYFREYIDSRPPMTSKEYRIAKHSWYECANTILHLIHNNKHTENKSCLDRVQEMMNCEES